MELFINNKELISKLNQIAMAYVPALELDGEINLLSNTYYSTIMSILHFGEGELNFRKGERFNELNLSPQFVRYCNDQLKEWNERGINSLDIAINTIEEFIKSGILSKDPVSEKNFMDMRIRIAEVLAESPLKVTDVSKLMSAFDDVVSQAARQGELGVITFMRDKLVELKKVRLSPTRGTEDNIAVWKLIAALIIFGFPVYKSLRCILKKKCCNTVSGLEGAIVFIAAFAWTLC
ncbi:MAG TPA: hypothetical protein PLK25_04385 [Bacteroidales bacterium]|jgi:hypothetical protein|nr:hypothetical protein [Bacteroidales bacterium]OQC43642.1 MAG: hypothetical protein BWX61_01159 [Bacteroidetes bacterium ADurb.Bin035]MDD3756352.1 hypothetical protein [Bacteroidales bacterium]HNT70051.1 hypothetical protein [Bacteroidales bacterium]HNY75741.1 hypothetical protein [Bacteroidales bacterium]